VFTRRGAQLPKACGKTRPIPRQAACFPAQLWRLHTRPARRRSWAPPYGVEEITGRAVSRAVDVLGVSVTFGQHDLATRLFDAVFACDTPPLVVTGGSLTARNERILLDRDPDVLIGRGGGRASDG
jgi:hypothetical protein